MKKQLPLIAVLVLTCSIIYSCKKKNTTSNKTTAAFVCNDDHVLITGSCCLYAPNIFSPNNDGINDTYTVISDSLASYTMTIKDTNSTTLYTTNSVANGWDGKVAGILQPETFYSARIQATFFNCALVIDTTTCFYLGKYNAAGCIPRPTTTPLYFLDQVDPIAPCSLPPYPTADTICP